MDSRPGLKACHICKIVRILACKGQGSRAFASRRTWSETKRSETGFTRRFGDKVVGAAASGINPILLFSSGLSVDNRLSDR
jgi:hypothetical protein